MSINEVDARLQSARQVANQLPEAQSAAQNVAREAGVQNNLYTYFIERRSQAQMLRASNRPMFDVVEPAKAYQTIEPKVSFALTLALMLGFFCPILFVYLKGELKDVVRDPDDIKSITDIPVIGRVFHYEGHKTNEFIQVQDSPGIESLRHLRTNLKFFLKDLEKAVILITSADAGEGKSFVASNLATLISMVDKKVILIDADLRKKKSSYGQNPDGLSSYLINTTNFGKIIDKSLLNPNLDIINSGPVPPNPFELLSSAKMEDVIAQLFDVYDYIIIDTPPALSFPDAFGMMRWSHLNLIVVRSQISLKENFADICGSIHGYEHNNSCIVLNDIPFNKKSFWKRTPETHSTFVEL
jgi:capsular exopolysaccharide synthesis family protein